MNKSILFFTGYLLSLLLCSCASVINRPYTQLAIHTNGPAKIVYQRDTFETQQNKVKLSVLRNRSPLQIFAQTDSLQKRLLLPAKNSSAYYLNLLYNAGIGMWVERDRLQRYAYPKRIYLDMADSSPDYRKYGPANHKAELFLHVSLPHMNHFFLQPPGEGDAKTNTGFLGFSIGLDYFYQAKQFFQVSVSGVTDLFLPIPVPVHFTGEHVLMTSLYGSVSHQHRLRRLTLGYGVSFGENVWDLRYLDAFDAPPPTRDPVRRRSVVLGTVFPLYYQLGANFHLGLIYRPTFLQRSETSSFVYEHLVSLDFAWKIRMK